MAKTRILAVSDTHVDDRMSLAGLNPVDKETGEPLVLAQARRMLGWVTRVARQERVDLIVHAGDAYERPRPSPASEAVFSMALDAWTEIAPVVVLLGNHDRPNGTDAHALEPLRHRRPKRLRIADRPEPIGVCLFGLEHAQAFVPIEHEHAHVAIFPVPYPSRSYIAEATGGAEEANGIVSEALDRIVLAHRGAAAGLNIPTILLGHGTLRGATYRPYQTVPLTDVQIRTDHFDAFDCNVWGHLHQRQGAPGWGDRLHGYVGSPDRHDFGEEAEPKGVTIFEVSDGQSIDAPGYAVTHRFEAYPDARRFHTLGAEDFQTLVDPEFFALGREQDVIFRVTGEVDEASYTAIAGKVRAMKAAGFIIRNDCGVVRADRARVKDVAAELGMRGALTAACQSRPDLAADAAAVMERAAQLAGGAL